MSKQSHVAVMTSASYLIRGMEKSLGIKGHLNVSNILTSLNLRSKVTDLVPLAPKKEVSFMKRFSFSHFYD